MSDYVSHSSTFEQLPNELLLIIFEYLDLYSIYNGFFGLNQQINSLLVSNLLPTNILALRFYNSWNDNSRQTFVNFFASRVLKLEIFNHYFDDFYNLANFPNVRLLILDSPSNQQLEQVNPHTLPHLKYLQVRGYFRSESENYFYFNPSNISHLHSIYIGDSCKIQWPKSDSLLCNLCSLMIRPEITNDMYLQILISCPNLIRLNIRFGDNYDNRIQTNPICHTNLRRLIVGVSHDSSGEILEFLLCVLPNLTHLIVGDADVRYDTLATILNRYTINLKFLSIGLTVSSDNKEYLRNSIEQAHPLFVHAQWSYPSCGMGTSCMTISSKRYNYSKYINGKYRYRL